MAVYNEMSVIDAKIESLRALDYPADQIRFFIGSDCSDDGSNDRLAAAAEGDERFVFFPFAARRGKPSIINDLAAAAFDWEAQSPDHLLIITDANVLLESDVVHQLAAPFNDPALGLVDSQIINTGLKTEGISKSENQYISNEVVVKSLESRLWKTMMGPFGGCYALRSDCFQPIPPHFLVDDFYLALCVFEAGKGGVNNLNARCYEAIPHAAGIEFRRKARIAAGSWQNLTRFWKLWIPPFSKVGFTFFSHKILRWLGPFFVLFMLISSGLLALSGNILSFVMLVFLISALFVPPIFDWILRKLGFHSLLLRGLSYFFYMNLALMVGFLRFLGGIRSGVWKRTERQ